MPKIHKGVLAQLQTVADDYKDQRCVSEQDLRLYVWFHEHLFNEILNVGGMERGYTFRQRGDVTLLVYKATFDGVHQVVFLTDRSPVRCMRSLCKRFYAGTLRWVPDKFA